MRAKAQAKRLLSGSSVAADLQASVQCHCRARTRQLHAKKYSLSDERCCVAIEFRRIALQQSVVRLPVW